MIVRRRVHIKRVQADPFSEILFCKGDILEVHAGGGQQPHDYFTEQPAMARPAQNGPTPGYEAVAKGF